MSLPHHSYLIRIGGRAPERMPAMNARQAAVLARPRAREGEAVAVVTRRGHVQRYVVQGGAVRRDWAGAGR